MGFCVFVVPGVVVGSGVVVVVVLEEFVPETGGGAVVVVFSGGVTVVLFCGRVMFCGSFVTGFTSWFIVSDVLEAKVASPE